MFVFHVRDIFSEDELLNQDLRSCQIQSSGNSFTLVAIHSKKKKSKQNKTKRQCLGVISFAMERMKFFCNVYNLALTSAAVVFGFSL